METTLEEKNQQEKNQILHKIMKDFDVYKWNNKRRLAAVNEGVDEASKTKHDNYLDIVMKWLEDAPQSNAIKSYLESNRGLIVRDMMSADFDNMNEE